MQMLIPSQTALVLGGGGAKGAYKDPQIFFAHRSSSFFLRTIYAAEY